METTLKFTLTGTRPMLLNNGRKANPMDPYTRQLAAVTKKRNKTDADHAQIAAIEARAAMYETPDGFLGLPVENVWACLYGAAKAFKLGETLKQALVYGPDVVPLVIDGAPRRCETYLSEGGDRLSYVSVVIQRRRTMRARPIIPTGWTATVEMLLLTDVLEAERLLPVLARAGRLVGLCDRRPIYGTFDARMTA